MPQEAIGCYQRALQVRPDYVVAYGECFQIFCMSACVLLGFSLCSYALCLGTGKQFFIFILQFIAALCEILW